MYIPHFYLSRKRCSLLNKNTLHDTSTVIREVFTALRYDGGAQSRRPSLKLRRQGAKAGSFCELSAADDNR